MASEPLDLDALCLEYGREPRVLALIARLSAAEAALRMFRNAAQVKHGAYVCPPAFEPFLHECLVVLAMAAGHSEEKAREALPPLRLAARERGEEK